MVTVMRRTARASSGKNLSHGELGFQPSPCLVLEVWPCAGPPTLREPPLPHLESQMLAFHMLYRWVCISPSRGSGEPKEAHSRTLKLYNMLSMFPPGVGAADGLTLSKLLCLCPSCQLAFLSLSLSPHHPHPRPPHSTPCTLGTASLEHSPSEHLAGGGPRDSCPFFYGQPSRPEYSRDILGLTVRPGLAGWGRLGGRLQTVFSSLQGRGWPGTRAVSEVAAKLAGEGNMAP